MPVKPGTVCSSPRSPASTTRSPPSAPASGELRHSALLSERSHAPSGTSQAEGAVFASPWCQYTPVRVVGPSSSLLVDRFQPPPPRKPGTFAANCLLARRLVERGVRFVQLYHSSWDHHGNENQRLDKDLSQVAGEIDQPCAALIRDLKSRGMLDDTLVIWGGEFGRTPISENRDAPGRNHHIDAFSMWFAGGGVKAGAVVGETDDLGFGATQDECHVHDLHATILHLLGIDHEKLTFRFQGRDFRLTDVAGLVIRKMLV